MGDTMDKTSIRLTEVETQLQDQALDTETAVQLERLEEVERAVLMLDPDILRSSPVMDAVPQYEPEPQRPAPQPRVEPAPMPQPVPAAVAPTMPEPMPTPAPAPAPAEAAAPSKPVAPIAPVEFNMGSVPALAVTSPVVASDSTLSRAVNQESVDDATVAMARPGGAN